MRPRQARRGKGPAGKANRGNQAQDLRKTLPFRQPAHQLGLDRGQLQQVRQGLAAVGARETGQLLGNDRPAFSAGRDATAVFQLDVF